MIVLDTNVLSEEMKPSPDANLHNWLLRQSPGDLFTTSVTEAELLYGIAILPEGKRKRGLATAAQRVMALFPGRILPFDSAAAQAFSRLASDRRRIGRPVQDFDAQIAAIALSRGMKLATRDIADFDGLGLDLIDPWS